MPPILGSNTGKERAHWSHQFGGHSDSAAPPTFRAVSNATIGQGEDEHYGTVEGQDGDGHGNSSRKSSGLRARMTQVFDFRSRRSSSGQTEASDSVPATTTTTATTTGPANRVSTTPKRLMWGMKKSTPDLRKISRGEPFDTIPEVPPPPVNRPETGFGRFTPPPDSHLHIPKNRVAKAPARVPNMVSPTAAKVEFNIGAQKVEPNQDLETWLTVTVTAEVQNIEEALAANFRIGDDVPLDVLILVDNSEEATAAFLNGACKNAFHVASALDTLVDRLAIGCISTDPSHNLDLLMPLGCCNFETIRRAFHTLPAFQLARHDTEGSRLCDALREGSNWLLRQSSRGSLRHIFLLTPQPRVSITDGCRPELLRLHTISPAPLVEVLNSKAFYGFHVSASFAEEVDSEAENIFKEKLKEIVGFLRVGVDPGVLYNLTVDLKTAPGTEIRDSLVDTKRKRLRPGESWSMLFRIVTAARMRNRNLRDINMEGYLETDPNEEFDVDEMIDELQGLLGHQDTGFENILGATVEYNQSVYPRNTILRTQSKCDIGAHQTGSFNEAPGTVQKAESIEGIPSSDEEGGPLGHAYDPALRGKKGRNFSRRLDGDPGEDGEQHRQQQRRATDETHPVYRDDSETPDESNKTRPRGDSVLLQSMNPYRALVSKDSDATLRGRESTVPRFL